MTNETQDEVTMQRWAAGLYVGLEIRIRGKDAIENDGIALGAALSDLQREGWRLEILERNHEWSDVRAVLRRSWPIDAPAPHGPSQLMAIDAGASA
jgi:hypothetical protein